MPASRASDIFCAIIKGYIKEVNSMKSIGIRALRENPGLLSQAAAEGKLLLVTNRSEPVSIALPFGDDLIKAGIHVQLAIKLFEEGVLTLSKAANLAHMSVEHFMSSLASLGITVVHQSADELLEDLQELE
jgi:predicted HTH domain antitoxin